MPLHLLGKKSWNVYNPANIARVKADEEAAAAREAAEEQRMQEIDAERRSAILRGLTPPPLPEETSTESRNEGRRSDRGPDGVRETKRRKLAGEDDTDMDIRLAKTMTASKEQNVPILQLKKPGSDAPLTDHAGNINLFPVDLKEVGKRDKNAEAEREKKKKERALEDQYTMRFSNAAGRVGLESPWYTAPGSKARDDKGPIIGPTTTVTVSGFDDKNVWGNEDPRRKERQAERIASNDPLAIMKRAQIQLKKSREEKKRLAQERERQLMELRATEEREERRHRHSHSKRKTHPEEDERHRDSKRHRHPEEDERHRDSKRHRHPEEDERDRDSKRHRHHHGHHRSRRSGSVERSHSHRSSDHHSHRSSDRHD